MSPPRCPICRTVIPVDATPRWLPFCSERCKLVDLGRWLDGDYVIPGPPVGDPEREDPDPD